MPKLLLLTKKSDEYLRFAHGESLKYQVDFQKGY